MNRKIIDVPVSKHLAHFISWEFGLNAKGVVVIPKSFILKSDPKNSHHSHTYFKDVEAQPSKYVIITLEYYRLLKIQQLCLVRQMEELFTQRMAVYVHQLGRGPYEGIREFLYVVLNLEEEDFKFSRGYKRYQRHIGMLNTRKMLEIPNNYFPVAQKSTC